MNKKFALSILLLLISLGLMAQDLSRVRKMFYTAANDPSNAACYNSLPSDTSHFQPLVLAYFGGIKAMKANTCFNPYSKWKYFSEGKQMIEEAVSLDNRNWEIRFIRFMIQTRAPSFLNYNNLAEDKKIILETISLSNSIEPEMKKIALDFINSSMKLTENETNRQQN